MPLSHVQRLPNSCVHLRSPTANDEGVANSPPLRSSYPTTLEAWRSDLHRAYLTRLCCAFSLSQNLGALFRSMPFRPCFVPVTPLGFERLQRFSLTGSGKGFSSQPVLRAVFDRAPKGTSRAAPRMCAPGESVLHGAVLPAGRKADPLLALSPSEVSASYGLSSVLPQSFLSWASTRAPGGQVHPKRGLLFRVSENHRGDLDESRSPSLGSLPGTLATRRR
jgi:hypothetical protein